MSERRAALAAWRKRAAEPPIYPCGHDIPIVMHPAIQFGRPTIDGRRVSTEAVAGRVKAGDSIAAVADDYGITVREVELAVAYETPIRRVHPAWREMDREVADE